MADGGFDLIQTLTDGANGQFQGGAPPPPVPAAAAPMPGQQFVPSVPAPTSPDMDVQKPANPPPAAPGFDLIGTLDAGSKGQFKGNIAQIPVQPGETPDQSIPSMALNAAINGPFATLAAARNAANTVANWGIGGVNSLTGAHIPKFETNLQPPLPVNPKTEGERMMVGALENTTGMIPQLGLLKGIAPLFKAGSMTANVLAEASKMPVSSIPSVLAGGAAGQYAADQVPEPYKNLAYFGGSMVGGLGEAGGQALGEQVGAAAGRTASGLGLAPKTTYSAGLPEGSPGIRATPTQAAAAVNKIRTAGGQNLAAAINSDPLAAERADIVAQLSKLQPRTEAPPPINNPPHPAAGSWLDQPLQQPGESHDAYNARLDAIAKQTHDRLVNYYQNMTPTTQEEAMLKAHYTGGEPPPTPIPTPPANNGQILDLQSRLHDIDQTMAQRGSQYERIPGEAPTLLQVAPGREGVSNNLVSLNETAAKNANPKNNFGQAAFEAQKQKQNAAQIGFIRAQAPAADPGALANLAMNEFQDQLKALGETNEARTTEGAPNAAAFNPPGNVAARGEVVRSGLEAQRTAERQRVTNDFFNAIDPTGTAQHTMLPAKQMANILLGNTRIDLPADAPPAMQAMARKLSEFAITPDTETHPAEMKELQRIAGQPDTKPYLGTKTLLSNIQIAKNTVGAATGYNSPNMTRLRLLEGSLNDSMSTDLPQRIQAERAVPPDMNTMPLEEALQHYVTRQTAPQEQAAVTRFYGPPPTVNPTAQSLQESRREWGRVGQTYDTGPVGGMLAKTDYGRYATPEVSTALENAIGSGPGMPERTAKVIDAANGNPQIMQAVQDHVVSKLGQLVTNPDGTLNVSKLQALQNRQHPAWQAVQLFPGVPERLNSAAGAQAELDATATRAANNYRQFGKSQLGKLLGNVGTPQTALRGQTLALQDPGAQVPIKVRAAIDAKNGEVLKQMAIEAQKNPAAFQELKQQVIERALDKFAPSQRAGAGMENALIDREGFRAFITTHKDPLRRLFGGQGMQHLDRAAASLQAAQAASKASVIKQPDPLRLWAMFGRLGNIGGEGLAGLAGFGGAEALGGEGPAKLAAAAMAGAAIHVVKVLREHGITTDNNLMGAMMLHPQFYRAMSTAFPPRPGAAEIMLKRLSTSLRAITQSQLAGSAPAIPKAQ